ncbi:addiction module toxin, RelE/StbE family [Spirochaetia bacterium]|nr:addiction module toxin, RelE/StbE family [Spirochaetia bacterium]
MLSPKMTTKMRKDIKRCKKRGYDLTKLTDVINLLCGREPLPEKFLDHPLSGDWADFRECHIENDWLLIYRIYEEDLVLTAARTGTHSDFNW